MLTTISVTDVFLCWDPAFNLHADPCVCPLVSCLFLSVAILDLFGISVFPGGCVGNTGIEQYHPAFAKHGDVNDRAMYLWPEKVQSVTTEMLLQNIFDRWSSNKGLLLIYGAGRMGDAAEEYIQDRSVNILCFIFFWLVLKRQTMADTNRSVQFPLFRDRAQVTMWL